MSSSYSSSRTSSGSCSCPKKEPEVTLDDVATVLADLNTKVLQLRKEIIALKDCPISKRSKGRSGNGSEETQRNKVSTRKAFQRKEEYFRKKIRSLIKKKESKAKNESDASSSTPNWSRAIQTTKQISDKEETRNVAFAPYTSEKLTVCVNKSTSQKEPKKISKKNHIAESNDEIFRGKSWEEKKHKDFDNLAIENWSQDSSDSDKYFDEERREVASGSGRKKKSINRYSSPTKIPHRIINGSQNRTSDKTLTEKSRLYSKNGQTNDSYKKHLRGKENGRMGINKMAHNSKKSKYEDDTEAITKHENNRIVLPSRVSMRCQGIRHAFGLSNLYCDCYNTGNTDRRLRIKKISRGIQCNVPNDNKCKRYCGLGVCFGFKGCTKKSLTSTKRNFRNSIKAGKSTESLEIYKPKEKRSTKGCVREKNDYYQICHSNESKNRRMYGGTDENNFQNFPPRNFDEFLDAQRHRNVMRHKNKVAGRRVDKNDVEQVKQRLNACLLELNGIIDDVKL